MGRTWPEIRAELHNELVAAGHADVWETVDRYLPGGAFSKYRLSILLRGIDERHGSSGLRAFNDAFDRVSPPPH